MKAYLTAFGGKLTGIIDLPENMPYIDLILDLSSQNLMEKESPLNSPSLMNRGKFERTGRSYLFKDIGIKGEGIAAEYKLISVG